MTYSYNEYKKALENTLEPLHCFIEALYVIHANSSYTIEEGTLERYLNECEQFQPSTCEFCGFIG